MFARITVFALGVVLALPAVAADRVTGQPFATRSAVYALHAMAATSQPLVTQIALDVMQQGGSALDAAIAADAALGLMEPTGSGVGGDLFAIVWDPKTHKLYGYNGSGRSPKSLTLAEFQKRGLTAIPPYGPLPVGSARFPLGPLLQRNGATIDSWMTRRLMSVCSGVGAGVIVATSVPICP